MQNPISPKYLMKLVSEIEQKIWDEFKSYKDVTAYITIWHNICKSFKDEPLYPQYKFTIYKTTEQKIDLHKTLSEIHGDILMKIAIDLGIETPHFIPGVPIFRNDLRAEMPSASETFEKAFKNIEEDPNLAIGLANSALESIIKEIIRDNKIETKIKGHETLYVLTTAILKEFKMISNSDFPKEIKTIGNSILTACQSIEKLRSEKTDFHGKTSDDYKINDPLYAYFVVNCVATVGLFLSNFYKLKFLAPQSTDENKDELPF